MLLHYVTKSGHGAKATA